jgi:quercetin dioxygenase-like cupin family protein
VDNLKKRIAELDKNLEQIRKLSNEINFKSMIVSREPKQVKFKFDKGECFLIHVAKTPEYAICEAEVTEQAEMAWHTHSELEIIVVLDGKMLVEYEDGSKFCLQKNDVLVIKNDIRHRVIYGEGKNWQLCITIPAAAEFPDGK